MVMVMLMFLVFLDIFFWFSPSICHSKFLRNPLLELGFMVFGCLLLLFLSYLLFKEIDSFILPSTDFSFLMLSTFRRFSIGVRLRFNARFYATFAEIETETTKRGYTLGIINAPKDEKAHGHFCLVENETGLGRTLTHAPGWTGDHMSGRDVASPGDIVGEKRCQFFHNQPKILTNQVDPIEEHHRNKINKFYLRNVVNVKKSRKNNPEAHEEMQKKLRKISKTIKNKTERYTLLNELFKNLNENTQK